MIKYASILAIFGLATPAWSGTIYAVDSNHAFGTMDTSTGVFSTIATQSQSLFSMGFAPNGTLYGIDSSTHPHLYTIDPGTGALTDQGATGLGTGVLAGTVGPDGLYYGITFTRSLFSMDPVTLQSHVIAAGFIPTFGALAFANGQLYNWATSLSNQLELVDRVTGSETPIGSPEPGGNTVAAAWDGTTLWAETDTNKLYSVDPATGVATFQANVTGTNFTIEAFATPLPQAANAAPEPGTAWLLGICVLGGCLGWARRRAPQH